MRQFALLLPLILSLFAAAPVSADPAALRVIIDRIVQPNPFGPPFVRSDPDQSAGPIAVLRTPRGSKARISLSLAKDAAAAKKYLNTWKAMRRSGPPPSRFGAGRAPGVWHRNAHGDRAGVLAVDRWLLKFQVARNFDKPYEFDATQIDRITIDALSRLAGRLRTTDPDVSDKPLTLKAFVEQAIANEKLPLQFMLAAAGRTRINFGGVDAGKETASYSPSGNTMNLDAKLSSNADSSRLLPWREIKIRQRATILHELWHAYWDWAKETRSDRGMISHLYKTSCRYARVKLGGGSRRTGEPAWVELEQRDRLDVADEAVSALIGQLTRSWMMTTFRDGPQSLGKYRASMLHEAKHIARDRKISGYFYERNAVGSRRAIRNLAAESAMSAFEVAQALIRTGLAPASEVQLVLGNPPAPGCHAQAPGGPDVPAPRPRPTPTPAPVAPTPRPTPAPTPAPAPQPRPAQPDGGPRNINDMLGPRGW